MYNILLTKKCEGWVDPPVITYNIMAMFSIMTLTNLS